MDETNHKHIAITFKFKIKYFSEIIQLLNNVIYCFKGNSWYKFSYFEQLGNDIKYPKSRQAFYQMIGNNKIFINSMIIFLCFQI